MPLEEYCQQGIHTFGDRPATCTIGAGMPSDQLWAIQSLLRMTFDHPDRVDITWIRYAGESA